VIPANKKPPSPLRRPASTRRATSPQSLADPQRLTAGRPGGQIPLEQQTRFFAENLRWIEAGCRLRADLADLEGVRRLLLREYGRLVRHWPSAAEGDREALHEVRIALRRLRTVLRAFRKRLEPTSARKLSRHLRQLNRDLGPARDLDAWEEFLRESGVTKGKFGRYPAVLHRRRQAMHRVVRRLLDPGAFRTLEELFDLLLRVELPQLRDKTASVPLDPAAGLVLTRQWRRTRKLGRHRDSRDDRKLHRLRIALRHLRYLTEAFAPILGEAAEKLRKRAHAVERLIAQVRDTSRDLARFAAEDPPPPQHLQPQLRDRRTKARAALEKAWDEFDDRSFRVAAKRALAAVG